jgi:hypothetical protein
VALALASSRQWGDSQPAAPGDNNAMIVRPPQPREEASHRLLLISAGLAVGALALAGIVCAWLSSASIRSDKGNAVVLNLSAAKRGDDKERRPDKEKGGRAKALGNPTRGAKKPEAPVGGWRQLTAAIEEWVRAGKTTRTKPVGGGDRYYHEVPKGGCLLIGLEVGVGQRAAGQQVISSLRAIYQSGQGRILGAMQGKQPQRTVTLEARHGYAVAGLTVKGGARLHGLSVTFMAVNGQTLERSRSYESAWAGGAEGKKHSLAGDGRLVVGIFGKIDSREAAATGLGLVTLVLPGRAMQERAMTGDETVPLPRLPMASKIAIAAPLAKAPHLCLFPGQLVNREVETASEGSTPASTAKNGRRGTDTPSKEGAGHAPLRRQARRRCSRSASNGTSRPFAFVVGGTALGTVLGAGYGALVMGTHFATAGRWDRGPAFAVTMVFVGSALGLLTGLVLALSSRDK